MELAINGRLTHPDKVCFNDAMNFGQFSNRTRPGVQIGTYELAFTRDEFLQNFAQQYEVLANEMREIDADEGDLSEFGEINYGALSVLLGYPKQLNDIVEGYLARDYIFPKVLSQNTTGIIINSVDQTLAGEFVSLYGRCWIRSSVTQTEQE